jgi:hypothetical protein
MIDTFQKTMRVFGASIVLQLMDKRLKATSHSLLKIAVLFVMEKSIIFAIL